MQTFVNVATIDIKNQGDKIVLEKRKLLFLYHVMVRTIDSCLSATYTDFDAHTTSTCCHGVAIYAQELIDVVRRLDLEAMREEGLSHIAALTQEKDYPCTWSVPEPLRDLARLYVLGFAKKNDPDRGVLTDKKRLKQISSVGTRFCDQIVDAVQKHVSNIVAHRYAHYLETIPETMCINGALVSAWGKYIQPEYLRSDKRGIYYASALFSMQVALAYLTFSKATIAVISDQPQDRKVFIFEGMRQLTAQEIEENKESQDPVIVFGGCSTEDQMTPWLDRIPSLVLACDTWYPQFPRLADDPTFDNRPIMPEEDMLQDSIIDHGLIDGVTASDSSLFCLAHIYPASLDQVLNAQTLPRSFIPQQLSFSVKSLDRPVGYFDKDSDCIGQEASHDSSHQSLVGRLG